MSVSLPNSRHLEPECWRGSPVAGRAWSMCSLCVAACSSQYGRASTGGGCRGGRTDWKLCRGQQCTSLRQDSNVTSQQEERRVNTCRTGMPGAVSCQAAKLKSRFAIIRVHKKEQQLYTVKEHGPLHRR